jgi:hypothetical protein
MQHMRPEGLVAKIIMFNGSIIQIFSNSLLSVPFIKKTLLGYHPVPHLQIPIWGKPCRFLCQARTRQHRWFTSVDIFLSSSKGSSENQKDGCVAWFLLCQHMLIGLIGIHLN